VGVNRYSPTDRRASSLGSSEILNSASACIRSSTGPMRGMTPRLFAIFRTPINPMIGTPSRCATWRPLSSSIKRASAFVVFAKTMASDSPRPEMRADRSTYSRLLTSWMRINGGMPECVAESSRSTASGTFAFAPASVATAPRDGLELPPSQLQLNDRHDPRKRRACPSTTNHEQLTIR
jgi:hypothetical protein